MTQHTFLTHKERFWWALHCLTQCKQLSKQSALAAASMRAALEAKGGWREEGMEGCDEKWYQIAGFPRGTLTHFARSETHPFMWPSIGMTSEHKEGRGGRDTGSQTRRERGGSRWPVFILSSNFSDLRIKWWNELNKNKKKLETEAPLFLKYYSLTLFDCLS